MNPVTNNTTTTNDEPIVIDLSNPTPEIVFQFHPTDGATVAPPPPPNSDPIQESESEYELELEYESVQEPEVEQESEEEPELEIEQEPEVEQESEEEPELEIEQESEEESEEEPEPEVEPEIELEIEQEPELVIEPEVEPEEEPEEESEEEPEIVLLFHPTEGYIVTEPEEAVEEPIEEAVEEPIEEAVEETVPTIIFIVPYRDRPLHKEMFDSKMKNIVLINKPVGYYKICYVHQKDELSFNRGAMKNIGFLLVKLMYPDTYQNITLVFNDVDTTPNFYETIPNYETIAGVVKHFYGYTHTLGGILSICAGDFEAINGFPNYWSWGFEDNMLYKRVRAAGYQIDRSTFYHIDEHVQIQHLPTSGTRIVNSGEFDRYSRNVQEGIQSIRNIRFNYDESTNLYNITNFSTEYQINLNLNRNYDITKGNTPFRVGYSSRRGSSIGMINL